MTTTTKAPNDADSPSWAQFKSSSEPGAVRVRSGEREAASREHLVSGTSGLGVLRDRLGLHLRQQRHDALGSSTDKTLFRTSPLRHNLLMTCVACFIRQEDGRTSMVEYLVRNHSERRRPPRGVVHQGEQRRQDIVSSKDLPMAPPRQEKRRNVSSSSRHDG